MIVPWLSFINQWVLKNMNWLPQGFAVTFAGSFSFFLHWISSCFNTIYWDENHFPIELPFYVHLCWKSTGYTFVGLFYGLSLLFCWSVGFPWASQVVLEVKNPSASAGDTRDTSSTSGSVWGRSPGEGNGTHSGSLGWRILWTEELGRLQSTGLQRAGHDWGDIAHAGGSSGKEPSCNAGDPGSIPGSGRSPEEGNSYRLQYSCLENSMVRGAWQATVHAVTKSQTGLSD